jgi:hypothetical protein
MQERLRNWILRRYIDSWPIPHNFHHDSDNYCYTSRVHSSHLASLGYRWLRNYASYSSLHTGRVLVPGLSERCQWHVFIDQGSE